jgi:hypothetical protein
MTLRQTAVVGGCLGLTVSIGILILLWSYGIWEIMFRDVDLRAALWPSSVMLTAGWCCTVPGILTTVSSIAINCLIYMAIALLLRAGIRVLKPRRGVQNS